MCSAKGKVKLRLATYAFVISVLNHSCRSQVEEYSNTIQDCSSSCGNIHNIAYPFRLNTDPKHCGTKKYQLSCENNTLMLYLKQSRKRAYGYRVQAINYNNLTIRVLDPNLHLDNCGLPTVGGAPLDYDYSEDHWPAAGYSVWSFTSKREFIGTLQKLIFIRCQNPMTQPVFQEYTSPCNWRSRHCYLIVNDFQNVDWALLVSQMEDSCRIEAIAVTSLPPGTTRNMSYVDVNNSFAYGLELSWLLACCSPSELSTKYDCRLYRYHYCDQTKQEMIIATMTSGLDYLFSYLSIIRVTWPADILEFLDYTFHFEQYFYDTRRDEVTIFGLIIYFLLAILVVLVLHRELTLFLGFICAIIFLIYKWKRRHQSAYDNVEEFLQSHHNCLMPVRYSYSEIKKFTRSFKEKLGEGGYGSVYKGKLRSGRFAAIKMLDKSNVDGQDFINEVATIGRIHHVNVVQLIGFCVEGSKRALIYEFMNNGSLDKHIFFKEGGLSMNNRMVFDISLGVAHGIEYLHQGCDMQILHFDIKPHNILLDEKFIPKISDFGLAKLHSTDQSIVSLTAARGTMGYIAPEFFYKNIGGISHKADVYSFGMLLMEMVGRRKNINASTEHLSRIYFPSWIYDQFNENKEIKFGDETEEGSNMVKKMIIVALWCIQLNPMDRPSMRKVREMLEGEVGHLKLPPKPFVAPQETPRNDVELYIN